MTLNGELWIDQGGWWSERGRSRPLFWPAGEDWFVNDPLGPMPHTHPGASEVFIVASGEMLLTVGHQHVHAVAGDLIFVPPNTIHEPRAIGDSDLCLLALVAPNLRDERWKISDFSKSDYEGEATRVNLSVMTSDLADENIRCSLTALAPGERAALRAAAGDTLIMPLDGPLRLSVGRLAGDIPPLQYINIMAETGFSVANEGREPARYLTILQGNAFRREA